MSQSEVDAWADAINNLYASENETDQKVLEKTNNGNYEMTEVSSAYAIRYIHGSNELSQEQKEFLLYKKFGITPEQVKAAVYDKHYK